MVQPGSVSVEPFAKDSDYENWLEYRYGKSQHSGMSDDTWQVTFFFYFVQSQTQKLRKFLKLKPYEKRELSRKVRFNLFLLDLKEKISQKARIAFFLIIGIAIFVNESGYNLIIPSSLYFTLIICIIALVLLNRVQRRLSVSYYPYIFGKRSHLFADCQTCMGSGVTEQMTCRTCNGIGMMVYFGDPHYAYTDEGLPRLDESERLVWNLGE